MIHAGKYPLSRHSVNHC